MMRSSNSRAPLRRPTSENPGEQRRSKQSNSSAASRDESVLSRQARLKGLLQL